MRGIAVSTTVNGDAVEYVCDGRETLLDVLRNHLGLLGAKEGCGTGDCGACTVLVDGRSVVSCMTLAVEVDGRQVRTIEGLAPSGEELHPLQQAFIDKGAIQCGYCTPGMVTTASALLEKDNFGDDMVISSSFR